MLGSLVVTDPPAPEATGADDVQLVQIAGSGAGRVATLSLGSYRIGPGRRAGADELAFAPVETTALEVVIEPDGVVTLDAPASSNGVRLDGSELRAPGPWRDEIVTAAGRAFVIDRRRPFESRRLGSAEADGTVPFSRPPRRSGEPARLPLIDARRDAMSALPSLWQRRPGQPDAYAIPIGLRPDEDGSPIPLELDLYGERAVAVTGADDERTAIARTILVEAATLHGPADLDVAIVTSPDRVAEWEWAKWLPHLRLGGPPTILSESGAITKWTTEAVEHRLLASMPWPSAHLTLLVIDDASMWQRRNSPLRTVLASPPAELRVIALCDDPASAPALCTTMITRTGNDTWRVAALTSRNDTDGVMLALTEAAVAGDIARAIAPLADVDLPTTLAPPETDGPARSLADLLGDLSSDAIRRRWDDDDLSAVVVGHRGADAVTVDLGAGNVVVSGSDSDNVERTASAVVLAACSSADPVSTRVLDLAGPRHGSRWGLDAIPHATDPDLTAADIDAIEPDRLIARLRHLSRRPDHPRHILVTVDSSADPGLANALLAATVGPEAIEGLRVVALADQPPASRAFESTIAVTGPAADRLASLAVGGGTTSPTFQLDRLAAPSGLSLRPAVLGRQLTPLEHRLEQRTRNDTAAQAEAERIAHSLSLAAGDLDVASMLPHRLPDHVDTDELFTTHAGDGIPIGLVDSPAAEPLALWWQPDPGIVLAFGAIRSGVDDVISTIVLGLVDRFGDDEVALAFTDRSAGRRRVVESLSQCSLVVDPERADDIAALIALLTRTRTGSDPTLVVLIDDVGRLRTLAAAAGQADQLDAALIGAAAVENRCSIVAIARSVDAPGPLLAPAAQRYVATMADPADAHRLGVSHPVDGPRGRCRQVPGERLVQLAVPDRPITTSLPQRLPEPTTRFGTHEEPS